MHISVHVRSGDPKEEERRVTTHSLLIYVALNADGRSTSVRPWVPADIDNANDEDRALDLHARHLVELRSAVLS
jgi:4-hydroxybenzoyl-CoA thioesterase